MSNNAEKDVENKIEKKDLIKVFFRSLALQGSWNYERMQALGFAYTMIPIIKKLYKTKEDVSAALKRHLEFFNTSPWTSTFIMGTTVAMEEENSKNDEFNADSINAIKAGLMGPLAGIGDTFFWGTFRVIAAAIGASLTVKGSPLGILLYILIFGVPHYLVRYNGLFLGYKSGLKFLNDANQSGAIQKITTASSIIGLMAVGGMTATMVTLKTPAVFNISGAKIVLQSIFDQLMPSILPLGLTLFVFYLINKKHAKTVYLLIGILVSALLGRAIGIL